MDNDMYRRYLSQLAKRFLDCFRLACGVVLLAIVIISNLDVPKARVIAKPLQIEDAQTCTEIGPSSLSAASIRNRVWPNGTSLRVKFIGGSDFVRAKVRYYSQTWSNYANIRFVFVESSPSDIRISFDFDNSSWSYIGTGAKSVSDSKPTMHFGWFDNNTSENTFRRTVLHEFGHALGLIHEHQSPSSGINWNKQAVYEYYKEHFEWNKKVVDENIFDKYKARQTRYSTYDPQSIMHYPIRKDFTTDGTSVGWNDHLSKSDLEFIKMLYP
jgi:serralysin